MSTPTPTCGQLARAAHWYAERGLAVFPVLPANKQPAVEDWEHAATTNHDQIDQTWSHRPYNIGIATGPSGLLVVDLDQPKTATDQPTPPWNLPGIRNGRNVLAALARRAGQTLPATYTVTTPSVINGA
jgi:Bifunctional DNA primase/polymerase, N-terminal